MSLALHPHSVLDILRPRRDAVRRRMAGVRRRVRRRLLLSGVTRTWGVVFAFCALSLAADWYFRLSLPVRIGLLVLGLAGLFYVAWRRLIRPAFLRLDDLDLAVIVDRRCPGVGQKVASVLQLPALLEKEILASPSMVHAAVLEHATELERTDLTTAFDRRGQLRLAMLLFATLAIMGGFVALFPQTAGLWARRWLAGSNERWPQRTYLTVPALGSDDRLRVPRGEGVVLEVDSQPEFMGSLGDWRLSGRGDILYVTSADRPMGEIPEKVGIRYQAADGPARWGNFTFFSDGRFRYELPQVAEPIKVTINGGDDWFGPFRVEPIDRPAVESLMIVARRPGGGPAETHTHEGSESQLLFLPDTELELELAATVPVVDARLTAKSGSPPVLERVDERRYRATWRMHEAQMLELLLTGREGNLASKPYYLSIGLLIDHEPRVTARSSGVGRRVTPKARIPFLVHALDDFGLKKLAIELEDSVSGEGKPKTNTRELPLELPPAEADTAITDFEVQREVALAEYGLAAGTVVKLRADATDNCAQGSQTGASRTLAFQVVTPEELFYEILMRQRAERAKFTSALELSKAQSEILATSPADQAAALVRKHQVIARQVWQVANRLDATLVEMTLNDLSSPQARELLQTKVIDAIRQLHGEQLTQLHASLESLAADPQASAALVEARQRQQEVVETMQKILEQMSQWENFVDVLNQLRSILKLESSVLDATEEEKKNRTKNLFDD